MIRFEAKGSDKIIYDPTIHMYMPPVEPEARTDCEINLSYLSAKQQETWKKLANEHSCEECPFFYGCTISGDKMPGDDENDDDPYDY